MFQTAFENITRRLDINPATRDTTHDKSRGKGRAIKKVNARIIVPSLTFNPVTDLGLPAGILPGVLVAQFNYTLPSAFRLLTKQLLPEVSGSNDYIACIRYREGTTVTRYVMRAAAPSAALDATLLNRLRIVAPFYENERLLPNFSIEYYTRFLVFDQSVTTDELALETNLLSLPANVDQTSVDYECEESLVRTDLAVALDETLPTTYVASSYWLNNT